MIMPHPSPEDRATLAFIQPQPATLRIVLTGHWLLRSELPQVAAVIKQLDSTNTLQSVAFDGSGIAAWDTGLLVIFIYAEIEHQHSDGQAGQDADQP